MNLLKRLFSAGEGPSAGQIKRALKQVTQIHGDPATRVGAMERLAGWKTPEAAAALLRRFTVLVPQASMDHEEKQYTVRLLVEIGWPAVEPILSYLETEAEVTWPVRALREILPRDEFVAALRKVLECLSSAYSRWPEAKAVMIAHLPEDAWEEVGETVRKMLHDDDDDVCIAAADYLVRSGGDEVREHLIQVMLEAAARPRVRGRILDHFCEKEWQVKGYRKRVEEIIEEPYYLTAKGTVKRRSVS
ncbi:MAG: HEAT repeat domain-containing protein [Acidobacteria bacterium]|nr:HEAT repeat domain-containing protein [Acidobacteriota bacterium]